MSSYQKKAKFTIWIAYEALREPTERDTASPFCFFETFLRKVVLQECDPIIRMPLYQIKCGHWSAGQRRLSLRDSDKIYLDV